MSLVAFLLVPGAAPGLDLNAAIPGIERRYNRPRTVQLDFEQVYTGQGRPPRTERGTVFLSKPRLMRWEYSTPAGKLFLSDGKSIYFYSPSAGRVERSPLKESGDLRTPLAFLMGRLDLRRDFREFRTKNLEGRLSITALPKSDQAPYSRVEFLVDAEFRIERLLVVGQDDSRMDFRFARERINPPLDPRLFEFRPPAGVELVEMSEDQEEF